MGPATVLSIEKGDNLNLSVFAKYTSGGSFGQSNNLALPNLGSGTSFGMDGASFLGNGIGLIFSPLHLLKGNSNIPTAYVVVHHLVVGFFSYDLFMFRASARFCHKHRSKILRFLKVR
jgi:hypothetical protein